jgi:hypothetical protein
MSANIKEQEILALEGFAFKASVPLFCALGEDADHCATGTFVETGKKLFLLTVRHVLDECEPQNIAITGSPADSDLFTLGNLIVHTPKDMCDVEIDIIGIEIQDQQMIDKIKSGWRVVDITIGEHPSISADKLLVGYPSDKLNKNGLNLSGKPIAFSCSLCEAIPTNAKLPIKPELDLFLQFPTEAVEKGGEIVEVNKIQGMSGCAIWELRELLDEEIWTPERALRLVGIQSSAAQDNFLRGKKWAYICEVLKAA